MSGGWEYSGSDKALKMLLQKQTEECMEHSRIAQIVRGKEQAKTRTIQYVCRLPLSMSNSCASF